MTEARTAYDYIGRYGRNPYDGDAVDGILVDHLADAEAHGAQPVTSAAGTQSVLLWDADGNADVFPVVCGDLIEVWTEDGPISGRCGLPVLADGYACEGHTAEREDWSALSEPEKAAWERSHDLEGI